MKAKILPISLTVIVGTIGFMIGRNTINSAENNNEGALGASSSMRSAGSGELSSSSDSRRVSSTSRSGADTSLSADKSKSDPVARMRALSEINDPLERARLWLQLVDSLSPDQFKDFVDAFRADGIPSERMGDYSMLLSAWAKTNPQEALDYASKATSNPFARQTILASWASYDPDSAISWAKTNHTGEGANPWMVGVIKGLAFQDPERASTLLKEMPRSQERGEALDNLLPALLKRGIAETRDWVDGITDPALKEGAMSRVAESTAAKDPQGTADWLVANPSEAANRRIDDALYAMASKDQTGALAYFSKLPSGDARSNALRGIINAVASDDPQKASALMDSYSGDLTDRAVQQFVYYSFRQDPQTAVKNISRMTNAEEQERMYTRTIEWWMERDQQAALTWVNGNTLPPKVVDRLNRTLLRDQERSN